MPKSVLNHVVVEPESADPESAVWMLVCHGLGDSHRGWLGVIPYLQLPQMGYVVVDAPLSYYDGYSWFRIPGLTGPDHGPEDFLADFRASHQALSAMIDELETSRGISPERLLLMGFSQGCQMVVAQALRAERRFRGVIGISGRFGDLHEYPQAFGAAAKDQDFLLTHGRFDGLLPIDHSREQVRLLRDGHGLRMDWREYDKEHSLDPSRELPEIRAWIQERLATA